MTLAIMQPYVLPYIGYIQLLNAVDTFVFYDDVAFINRGWVNRNRLLVNGNEYLFTIPLKDASQNKLIREIELANDPKWRGKLLKTIEQSYRKAPQYGVIMPMAERIINFQADTIADYIFHSFSELTTHLGITTRLVASSTVYENGHLKAQERIVDICRQEGAERYINPIGGTELYSQSAFEPIGCELRFIQPRRVTYPQTGGGEFVPWLSIVDLLMNLDAETIRPLLTEFDLTTNERISN
ncbi:WbqC family protein [Fibrella forsythiae]|uniref:WbqC family protein n=1 Tax=Fibrella forsythiae TaxID=2817061 RepID=A0ABS3JQX8_9BACT|nr:WbqC family protein [Fibrella forsythiae]MBO0952420.1 WbqC family protein [Fibrella forsythiae]